MSWLGRLLDRAEGDAAGGPPPIPNQKIENAPEFVVVFPEERKVDPNALAATLRRYHPAFAEAAWKADPHVETETGSLGLVGWSGHVIRLIGQPVPLSEELYQRCVAHATYGMDVKEKIRTARSQAILRYVGWPTDGFEQYLALAAAAGCLARQGAIAVLNPGVGSSLPTATLAPGATTNMLGHLQALSLLKLFAGFQEIRLRGAGSWLRTRGCYRLGLPDIALYDPTRTRKKKIFDLLSAFVGYLRTARTPIGPGDTATVGGGRALQFRLPTEEEADLLPSEGRLLIAEEFSA